MTLAPITARVDNTFAIERDVLWPVRRKGSEPLETSRHGHKTMKEVDYDEYETHDRSGAWVLGRRRTLEQGHRRTVAQGVGQAARGRDAVDLVG